MSSEGSVCHVLVVEHLQLTLTCRVYEMRKKHKKVIELYLKPHANTVALADALCRSVCADEDAQGERGQKAARAPAPGAVCRLTAA
jgi:hypothetical protein